MTLEVTEEQALFYSQLKALYEEQNDQDLLARFRAKGWDHFEELGLPSRKTEVFQYVPLNKLYTKSIDAKENLSITHSSFEAVILPECKDSYVVFVNGNLDLTLSNISALPSKVVLIPLKEALRSFGSFINNQVARCLQEELDPFAALNAAFIQNALFFYVPPNVVLDAPLQIIQIISGNNQLVCPRIECFFGALSEAEVIMTTLHLESSGNIINAVINIALEEGAQIGYSRLLLDSPHDGWHFDATRAVLKKDSRFTSVMAGKGASCYRDDYRVSLVGANADVHLNGVALLQGRQECHTHVFVDHQAPDCKSLQVFKNSLDGSSKASFEGKIYVHRLAQKTAAFQLNNNVFLSEGAQSNSKPNLEIFADDVKASHGATFGSLDEEQLFYLLTRGISRSAAKSLLVQGFCLEVIEKFKISSLLKAGRELAKNYLN